MAKLADYQFPAEVNDLVGPVVTRFEGDQYQEAERSLALLALALLDRIEKREIEPETADQVFTLLDIYLTDLKRPIDLSEEAQELILEGEYLHHYGHVLEPDPAYLRRLASTILERVGGSSVLARPGDL